MRTLVALRREDALGAPQVGVWKPSVRDGDAIEPGRGIGELRVLGRRIEVVAPGRASGEAVDVASAGPVGYGDVLLRVGARSAERLGTAGRGAGAGAGTAAGSGIALRAPIDGIFYRRPSPDAAAFVNEGDRVAAGQTLGLIEVMKTFNPIRSDRAGTVVALEADDQQEVAAGDVLLVIDAG